MKRINSPKVRLAGLTIAVALLLQLQGSGVALGMDVGDTFDLVVPDISYFPEELQTRQFTCRAVTANAYWLVQDTTYIDLPDTIMTFQIIWENLFTQVELDSLSAQFEGTGVNVWGTVTEALGDMPVTVNNDDRIWIVIADFRDYYPAFGGPGPTRIGNWVYTWPDDFDGSSLTGNNHDIFYVNLGPYKNMPGVVWEERRGAVHTWSIPTGLGQLLRIAHNRLEDKWIVRGLGVYAQHLVYGLTSAANGGIGIEAYIKAFRTAGSIELTWWRSGQKPSDFGENLGSELLWLKYIEQRVGTSIILEIVQSDDTGMFGIARAIDPTVPDSLAITENIYPLYEDWLITNLIAGIADGFCGGIYQYDFLEGAGFYFGFIGYPASMVVDFDEYPIPTWIAYAPYGMVATEFAAQYAEFGGDYQASGDTSVYFNGMFNQNNGSGANIDGKWTAYRVVLSDDSTVQSLDSLQWNELYNGQIQLEGDYTYLILTNGNPGGPAGLRFTLSQDTSPKSLLLSVLHNALNQKYLLIYSSLYLDSLRIPYSFDWVGPNLEISHFSAGGTIDSTAIVEMDNFYETFWSSSVEIWTSGTYRMVCSGYDSLGISHQDTTLLAVAMVSGGEDLHLEITGIRFDIPGGAAAPGSMIMLAESDLLGLAIASQATLEECGAMTGIVAGPVTISDVMGTLRFEAENGEAAIHRYDAQGWHRIESYYQNGYVCAPVDEGGVYVLGDGPGISSPELPVMLQWGGSFPNPFQSETMISFALPGTGYVSLKVYDIAGRLVRTLADGDMSAANHAVFWDGRDHNGDLVGAGVYFCRLEARGQIRTGKMVRIR